MVHKIKTKMIQLRGLKPKVIIQIYPNNKDTP